MADIIKFPSSAKKIGDIAGDDFLLDLLYRAAMNPDSEITMDDYEKYKKTGSFAEGGLASLPGSAPGGPVGFTGEKSWPSIRADANAFDQILETANFKDKNAFHRALKRAGIDNADLAGKKNFINQRIRNIWRKKGLPLKNAPTYQNVMTHAGKFNLEQAIGIVPGTEGAPGNVKIWEEGKKLEEKGLKKFKNKGDRIKHMVDGMYKKFGHVKGVTKTLIKSAISRFPGFLSATPWGTMLDISTRVATQPEVMETTGMSQEPLTYKGGGLMDINDMTRPVGYDDGGDVTLEEIIRDMQDSEGPGEPGIIDRIIGNISPVDPIFTAKEKMKSVGKSLIDKVNDFLKYGHGDREDYMEIGGEQMDPDDPNFRRFIEENYMGEGESYIEGIENYRREVEERGYRRGGIVSINRMTRTL